MTDATVTERLAASAPTALFSLSGKRVLVTGASSGMGEAIALAAAAAGAEVVGVARRLDRLQALAAACPAITPVACDLGRQEAREAMVEEVRGLGRIDVLVNAAGAVGDVVPAEQETPENIARTMEVNLLTPMHLARAFAPGMREAGSGAILNIASISGVVGVGRIPQAAYVASKTGLVGVTRELAAQWGRWGIRVNAIAAGYFRSDLTVDMFASEKMMDWMKPRQPLKRIGAPEDFAGTALLLCSDAGRFITGQTFAVDGGWTAV